MIFQIDEDNRIITDEFQFIVQKRKIKKDTKFTKKENIGKIVWEDKAYYPSMCYTFKYLAKNIVLRNNDLDIIVKELTLLGVKIEGFRRVLEKCGLE